MISLLNHQMSASQAMFSSTFQEWTAMAEGVGILLGGLAALVMAVDKIWKTFKAMETAKQKAEAASKKQAIRKMTAARFFRSELWMMAAVFAVFSWFILFEHPVTMGSIAVLVFGGVIFMVNFAFMVIKMVMWKLGYYPDEGE